LKRIINGVVTCLLIALPLSAKAFEYKTTPLIKGVIQVLSVEAEGPAANGIRPVTITYQSLRSCRYLSLYGNNYSKDDVQLDNFLIGGIDNVAKGQKFRKQVYLNYEPQHYIVIGSLVSCRN
jgi:hypothetical protein